MKALIDTNVLLDVALGREPHLKASQSVLRWFELHGGGCIAWHSVSNCAYLLGVGGREFIEAMLTFLEVVPTGTADARRALTLPMKDLEDALQVVAALAGDATAVVTRDQGDYRNSPVRAFTPAQFLERIESA